MKWMALLTFGGVGLLAFIAGLIWGVKRSELFWSGLRAQGVVVDTYKSVSGNPATEDDKTRSGPGISYYPVVEYKPDRGGPIRFRGSTGSGVPDYETGAVVTVVYRRESPDQAKILTFSQFWLGPLVATVAGFIFLAMGVGAFFLIGQSDRKFQAVEQEMRQQLPNPGQQ